MDADVRLLDLGFDVAAESAAFACRHPEAGGIATFLGQVRSGQGSARVLELELVQYPPMTLPGMQVLARAALGRWPLAGLTILHRIGRMAAGEPIVWVAAASRHRRDALQAVDFTMDHLKSEAWFWKRERTALGWRWVEPREEDLTDVRRWRAPSGGAVQFSPLPVDAAA